MTRCLANLRLSLFLAVCLAFLFGVSASLRADAPARKPSATAQKITAVEGITEYRLDNGVRILLFPDTSTPKVTVNCIVFVGSRHEGYGETGMAHLLEHMLFKGCRLHPKPTDIPKALRDRGAVFNATTADDRTNFFETLNASDDNLEFAIRLEADRLVHSFIRREDLASEMTVVRNEFERGENNPRYILLQRMLAVAYEWHNYGKSTIGNRSDIERVPIDKLQAFYRKYYRPDNVMVVVAGNFKETKALDLISKYFGALENPKNALPHTYTQEPPQDGERKVVLRRAGEVGMVGVVYHVPAAAHADCAALDVLSDVLTLEPSGRLYKELVEKSKQFTSVSAAVRGLHDPGVFIVAASVDEQTPVETARDALLRQIDKACDGEFTKEEVERAKSEFKNNWKLAMTRSNRIGVRLSNWASRGDWRLMFLHRDRVAKVTPADIRRVARKYLTATNRTVGLYVPTKERDRAEIPQTPNVAKLLKDYKSSEVVSKGESFDPTVKNIAGRVQSKKLAGGVQVVLLPRKTRGNRVTLRLSLHYGNAESLKGHTSATQFLALMMERGTKKHSRQQLVDEFNRLEAKINAGGVLGDVTFAITCKRDTLPRVLALLTEVLREPVFPANEFDVLKRGIREELEESKTNPRSLAIRAMRRKLSSYPKDDVRYTPTIAESIERLDAVTLDEVRKLYEKQLGGRHGELVVIGDFDPAAMIEPMEKAFKDWKASVAYQRIERPMIGEIEPARVVIDTPDKENAIYLAVTGMALKDTDADHAALVLADFLFGGGSLSSRLANRVRQEKGLSYGVMSHYSADAQDSSAQFFMFASCNPKNIDKLDKTMREELDKMHKDGISETELREAKAAYLASLKQRRGNDRTLAATLLKQSRVGRSIAYYGDLEKKIAALTVEEVNRAFRNHIDPKKLVIIRAGDFEKK